MNNSVSQQQNVPNNLEEERYKADKILTTCKGVRADAIKNYNSLKIQDAIKELNKEKNFLLRLKVYIETKATYLNDYLPYIIKTITENNNLLNKYSESIYLKFREIFTFKPKDNSISITHYINQYILETPFITFDDIFDPIQPNDNNNLKKYLKETYRKVIISKNKTLLLYGPKGCGKSIAAMAIANEMDAKFIQIDNVNFFSVENFAIELSSLCIYRQPIILYIKNIESMYPALQKIFYIFDRILLHKTDDKIFIIASSTCKPKQLDKKLYTYFVYLHYIGPFIVKYKKEYIQFICKKVNINLNVSNEELEKLCSGDLKYYSNEDIYKILYVIRELNENDNNLINGNVINYNDLIKGIKLIPSSISPEIIKQYDL